MTADKNKLFFLEHTDPEFKELYKPFPDPVMRNKEYGEVLQYLGTVIKFSGEVVNQFRHRALPVTNERKYWEFKVSDSLLARVKAGEFNNKVF